jgi:hypothetical protein
VDDQFRLTICDFGSHRIQVYKKEGYELAENQIALPRSCELRRPGPVAGVRMSSVPGAIGLVNPRVPWYNRQAR